MLAFPLYVNDALPPFVGNTSTGNIASYAIAAQPGSYATAFDIASGSGMSAMTCASSAVWLPGP